MKERRQANQALNVIGQPLVPCAAWALEAPNDAATTSATATAFIEAPYTWTATRIANVRVILE